MYSLFVTLLTIVALQTGTGMPILGESEPILIGSMTTGNTANAFRTIAKIDTGASRSSIDRSIAMELGIDLENAEKVTIVSALGEEERPLVPVVLVINDTLIETEATVSDRSHLSTLALVGGNELQGFLVDMAHSQLTTPNTDHFDRAITTVVSGPQGFTLLALLPLMAILVLIFRSLLGIATIGMFTPILLSLSFLAAESWVVILIFIAMIMAGFLAEPLLRKLKLSRAARLSMVLIAQIAVLFAAYELFNSADLISWALAVPVIVTIALIERLWDTWESKGLRDAFIIAVWTIVLAGVAAFILAWEPLQAIASRFPFVVLALTAILSIVLGRYRGLRVSELWRFRQLRGAA